MAELPNAEAFVGSGVTESGFKAAQTQLIDFIGALDGKVSAIGAGHYGVDTYATADTIKSSLPAGTIIEVGSDPDTAKNGSYTWNGTILKKNDYDPGETALKEAKNYFDQSIKVVKGGMPFQLMDMLNDVSIFWIDKNGQLFSINSDLSINQLIDNLNERTSSIKNESTLQNPLTLVDTDFEPLIYTKKNGHLYIHGQDESVQEMFQLLTSKMSEVDDGYKLKRIETLGQRDIYVGEYLDRLNYIRSACSYICPVPKFMSKQRFILGKNWVDSIKLTVPAERVVIAGYDPSWNLDIGVVHPQLIVFEQKMAGYKYWLGLNPYTNTNENIELPYIYGSNDPELKTWELISDFPTPFDRDPQQIGQITSGFCSDSGFVYDIKRGDLIFFWRRTLRYNGQTTEDQVTNEIVAKYTSDGKNWSDFVWLRNAYTVNDGTEIDQMLSPNIVYNPSNDLFYMYSISNGKMYYRTTNDIRSCRWSAKIEIVLSGFPALTPIWHFDMRFVGDKLVAMIHVDAPDSYYFAVSEDMHNFVSSQTTIVTNSNPNLYKPTFLPMLDGTNLKMRCIFTTDPYSTVKWQLKVADTTTVSIED